MVYPDSDEELVFEQVSFFLGQKFLVTVQEDGGRDVFEKIRERLRVGRGVVRRSGPDYLAYALLDAAVDSIFPVLESVGDIIEDVEENLLEKPRRESLRRLYETKRLLLALRRSAWLHREIFNTLPARLLRPRHPDHRHHRELPRPQRGLDGFVSLERGIPHKRDHTCAHHRLDSFHAPVISCGNLRHEFQHRALLEYAGAEFAIRLSAILARMPNARWRNGGLFQKAALAVKS